MLLRLAKSESFLAYSPSALQVANMKATGFSPLVLEPESKYYTCPVIVLDFQSLYPSLVIAYNLCFSTCLGSMLEDEIIGADYRLKFSIKQLMQSIAKTNAFLSQDTDSQISNENRAEISAKNKDNLVKAPNGAYFVPKSHREGLLSKMLQEILTARQLIKKITPSTPTLEAFQSGLKLLANTTYGYTGANRTGRMPMMEVGDAIVSLGRRTLEDAILAIEAHPDWNAKVVYGDTDSLFVALKGAVATDIKSLFALGREIALFITERNPKPVKLKFEKIYTRSILMAKKRYIGWKAIEGTGDTVHCQYEAKGVESVRRDYCPLAAKVLEKFCSLLFEHGLATALKYFAKVCLRLLEGYYATSDLLLTKPWRPINSNSKIVVLADGAIEFVFWL